MPVLVGQYFECKIWRRKPNSGQYEDTFTTFRAKVLGDKTSNRNTPLQGIIARSTNLVIETIDLEQVNINDRIQILGDNYQVDRVSTKKVNSPYTLGSHKKKTEHLLGKLPKIIYLV